MKKLILLLSFLSVTIGQSVYAQSLASNETKDSKTQGTSKAYYILNADDKTVEIDNTNGNFDADIAELDARQIESISVLKDQSAVDKYGENAKKGVLVITFKDYKSLSEGSKQLFEKFKKKNID